MSIDVLILSNDQVLFSEAAENVKKFFGVTPRVLNDAKSIARGYNTLAKQSDADILCFMHQDARVEFPVNIIYDYFKGLPKVGVLGFCGSARHVPGKQWWECQPTYGALMQGQGDQAKPLTFNFPTRFTPQGKHGYQPVQTVDGYCLFIKRKVFEQLSGFDEEYKDWHGYDIDICAKALDAGFQNYVIQQPSTHFSWGAGGPELDAALARFKEKWDMRFSELNRPVKLVERTLKAPERKRQGKLKIVVYTICRDELQFVEKFVNSCADADGIYVLDTGSTDGTPDALAALGVNVEVKPFDRWKTLEEYDKLVAEGKNPWRFDIARNLSIDMCPDDADILVCIDMDEVLVPGWRKVIEDTWVPGTNHMSYLFAWSMNGDKPHHCFWYEKFHSRHEYVWVSPVHEAIVPKHGVTDHRAGVKTCLVHHYPDGRKSRGQYLPLLELAVREAPNDPRVRFYLGREYTFNGRHQDAIDSHKHLLNMPNAQTARERANACQQIAACYGYLKDTTQQFNWLLRAVTEVPGQREPWVDLADFCRLTGDHVLSYWAAKKALAIPVSACDDNYLVDPACWKEKPHDIASVSAWWGWKADQREEAMQEAWEALGYSPWDGRLEANYRLMQNLLAKPSAVKEIAVDVIILAYSKTEKEYKMTKEAIQSLRNSSPGVGMRFVVVETNTKLAEESFADKVLFGEDVKTIFPPGPFGFNKFLNFGYGLLQGELHSLAKYVVCMNNDVTMFNPGFMSHMLEGMKSVSSASPLGLREATWGLVNRNVPIDENYDINRAVNGWFLMFDKRILNALPFEKLFPPEFTWYNGDIHYARLLDQCGYKHGMINAAQALHLQKQSHPLRTPEQGPTGPTGSAVQVDAPGPIGPADRNAMLKLLGLKGKSCVEVGTGKGEYAELILAEDPKLLLLVDPWKHQDYAVYPQNDSNNVDDAEFERRLQGIKQKFDNDPRVVICRAFSVQAAKLHERRSLDFVYIDAVHTTSAVAEDVRTWWPLVKSGGWMCGHDYSHPDVAAAVNEFVKQNCLTLTFVTKEDGPATSWGLRKPEPAPETGENDERIADRDTAGL